MRLPTENLGALAPYLKDVLASGVLRQTTHNGTRSGPHRATHVAGQRRAVQVGRSNSGCGAANGMVTVEFLNGDPVLVNIPIKVERLPFPLNRPSATAARHGAVANAPAAVTPASELMLKFGTVAADRRGCLVYTYIGRSQRQAPPPRAPRRP